MRLFLGGSNGLVLYEDGDVTSLHQEPVLCALRTSSSRLVAGTASGWTLVWEGNGDSRVSAKDLGDAVHSLAQTANNVLFAGSMPANTWVSKDGGDSWKLSPALAEAPNYESWTAPWGIPVAASIAAHPKDAKTLYVGIEQGGIYRTRDAGRRWFDLEIPGSDVHSIQICPANHLRIYVTTGEGSFCSDDEGFNWRLMGPTNARQYTMGLAAHPTEADRVIISAAEGPPPAWGKSGARCDIYLSTDAGRRFRTVAKGLNGGVGRKALVINSKVPSEIVFGTSLGELYYSNDGGESFDLEAKGLGDLNAIAFA